MWFWWFWIIHALSTPAHCSCDGSTFAKLQMKGVTVMKQQSLIWFRVLASMVIMFCSFVFRFASSFLQSLAIFQKYAICSYMQVCWNLCESHAVWIVPWIEALFSKHPQVTFQILFSTIMFNNFVASIYFSSISHQGFIRLFDTTSVVKNFPWRLQGSRC